MRFKLLTLCGCLALGVLGTAKGQGAPPVDFRLAASAGAVEPYLPSATFEFAVGLDSRFVRYRPDGRRTDLDADASWTPAPEDAQKLWNWLHWAEFFDMNSIRVSDSPEHGGAYARITVTAEGQVRTVFLRNMHDPSVQDILNAINRTTPGDLDIAYRPYSSGAGKREAAAGDRRIVATRPSKERPSEIPRFVTERSGAFETVIVPGSAVPAHGGTMVGHHMSLSDAVGAGIVSFASKGNYFGDAVSITVDNSAGLTPGSPRADIYLETWGSTDASVQESVAGRLENAIESAWSGQSLPDGTTFEVDVHTTVSGNERPAGSDGWHQVEIRDDSGPANAVLSSVDGGEVNGGSATVVIQASHSDAVYAHEAGHLFDLPDRYEEYTSNGNETWNRDSDGQTFTTDEVSAAADAAGYEYYVRDGMPAGTRFTHPKPGSVNDLMGNIEAPVSIADISDLVDQAALVIEMRAGDVLVSRDSTEQNLVITKDLDFVVPKGGSATLEGIFAACISESRRRPTQGTIYDLAPPLSEWTGSPAAEALLLLTRHIHSEGLWDDPDAQRAIWRISDRWPVDNERVREILTAAGVPPAELYTDFPDLTPPPGDPGPEAVLVIPTQLFSARVTPNRILTDPGVSIALSVERAQPPGSSPWGGVATWSIVRAPGTSLATIPPSGDQVSFTPDVRGHYLLRATVAIADTTVRARTSDAIVVASDTGMDTFEGSSTGVSGVPWTFAHASPWALSQATALTGAWSFMSGDLASYDTTSTHLRFSIPAPGELWFGRRVSSQQDHDFLVFEIDGAEIARWSGEAPWESVSHTLPAGDHRVVFHYHDDDGVLSGEDRAWIDDVMLPLDAVAVAIESPRRPASLGAAYPNPFTHEVSIPFSDEGPMEIRIYDVLGRRVAAPATTAGGVLRIDGRSLASGLYFVRVVSGASSRTIPIVRGR